ncbi:MAG TPA: sugar phosphate isomerase/epimerase family protein [Draconibacterium sp.]|nr:sugar phosphate isomerase/epimerase family protein [Draconibacterium sp.]
MELGIFSKTFVRPSLNEVLNNVKEHGYTCLQFNMASVGLSSMPDFIPENLPREVHQLMTECGLQMSALSGTFNMIHPDKKQRELGLERLGLLIHHAKEMGTDMITLCTGSFDSENMWRFHPENNSITAWRILSETMESALSLAEDEGIYLGIEPELANVINSAEKAKQIINEMQSKHLKIVFDPANLFEKASQKEIELIIGKGLDLLAEHIQIAHAKDRTPDGSFATAGKGILPYRFFLKEINQTGFDGPLITHGLEEDEAEFCYNFLNEQLNRI